MAFEPGTKPFGSTMVQGSQCSCDSVIVIQQGSVKNMMPVIRQCVRPHFFPRSQYLFAKKVDAGHYFTRI